MTNRKRGWTGAPAAIIAIVLATVAGAPAGAQEFKTEDGRIRVVTVASGLEHPWGLAFLPDGRMLVTERPGRLRIIGVDGKLSAPVEGVPEVYETGQGGLLDVALDPRFSENRLVYLAYSEPDGKVAGTAVARGKLADDRLEDVQVIFRQQPKVSGPNHWGSRLVFAPDGERFQRDRSQNLNEHLGKLVRINPDGSVPEDNPFTGRDGIRPEIFSLGHRNMQGAALHPRTQRLWIVDHGARGGDEINIPEPGKNYGWPIITFGRDYSGLKIGEGTSKPGLELPIHYWDPSIAPSGMAFYTGDRFPAWKGDLFVGALAAKLLARLELDGTRVVQEERLLKDLDERIRDVRQGPDGLIYLLTDASDGRVLRVEPAT